MVYICTPSHCFHLIWSFFFSPRLSFLFHLNRLYGHLSFQGASQGVHMLPTSSSFSSSSFFYLLFSFVIFFVTFSQPLCLFFSGLLLHIFFAATFSSSSLTLCAPFLSTHQSLALASPLRTYGMMDCRASGASQAKGHLPGALRCRGALGPAMQPRPRTSVSRHSHNMHTATAIMG